MITRVIFSATFSKASELQKEKKNNELMKKSFLVINSRV